MSSFNWLRNTVNVPCKKTSLNLKGNVVRIGPNEVYYSSSSAYRAIYAQVPSLIKGPYYNQFNSIEGVGNLFTEQNRDQHHHYKSTFSSLFSRRNIAKMEDMIKSKCDMLKGHLFRKADAGENVDILAAVRSLATDVISMLQLLGKFINA
jgi:cytochrome P450